MKTYKEIIKVNKELLDTLCDCCGDTIVDDKNVNYYSNWACSLKLFSFWDGPGIENPISKSVEYDICPKCFSEKFKPLLSRFSHD